MKNRNGVEMVQFWFQDVLVVLLLNCGVTRLFLILDVFQYTSGVGKGKCLAFETKLPTKTGFEIFNFKRSLFFIHFLLIWATHNGPEVDIPKGKSLYPWMDLHVLVEIRRIFFDEKLISLYEKRK